MGENIIVGIVTGLISSTIIAIVFYSLGRLDTEDAALASWLNSALMKLHRLGPNRLKSIKYGDGVTDTEHWFRCAESIMKDEGRIEAAKVLGRIAEEMMQRCPKTDPDPEPQELREAGEEAKDKWKKAVRELRSVVAPSPIARIANKLDGRD